MAGLRDVASLPTRNGSAACADAPPAAQDAASVRLRDCLRAKLVVPSAPYGVRQLLNISVARRRMTLDPVVETESFELIRHYVVEEDAVGFQIPIGLSTAHQMEIAHRPIAERDVPPGRLLLGQMRGRVLPVGPSTFARQLEAELETRAVT